MKPINQTVKDQLRTTMSEAIGKNSDKANVLIKMEEANKKKKKKYCLFEKIERFFL